LGLELFNSERAPIYPHRLIVMQPLIKRIGGFGLSTADNKFCQEPIGTSLHNFESYRCVVGSQAARKLTAAGLKASCDFRFLLTRY